MTTPKIRTRAAAAGLAFAAVLAAGLLSGCGDGVDCSLSQCTITFDRGEEGKTNVLGVDVELVSATDTTATVSVAGREASVPIDGSREVGGFTVQVESITDSEVVVKVSR